MPKGKKSKRKKVPPSKYKLRTAGVANKEKFLKGCMALLGLVFLFLFMGMVYTWLFGGQS